MCCRNAPNRRLRTARTSARSDYGSSASCAVLWESTAAGNSWSMTSWNTSVKNATLLRWIVYLLPDTFFKRTASDTSQVTCSACYSAETTQLAMTSVASTHLMMTSVLCLICRRDRFRFVFMRWWTSAWTGTLADSAAGDFARSSHWSGTCSSFTTELRGRAGWRTSTSRSVSTDFDALVKFLIA